MQVELSGCPGLLSFCLVHWIEDCTWIFGTQQRHSGSCTVCLPYPGWGWGKDDMQHRGACAVAHLPPPSRLAAAKYRVSGRCPQTGPWGCIFCACLTAAGSTIAHIDDAMCKYGLPRGAKCSGSPVQAKVFCDSFTLSIPEYFFSPLGTGASKALRLWMFLVLRHIWVKVSLSSKLRGWTKSMGLLCVCGGRGGPARGCIT